MCGITGFLATGENSSYAEMEQVLLSMRASITHRGPDDLVHGQMRILNMAGPSTISHCRFEPSWSSANEISQWQIHYCI